MERFNVNTPRFRLLAYSSFSIVVWCKGGTKEAEKYDLCLKATPHEQKVVYQQSDQHASCEVPSFHHSTANALA